MTTPSIFDATGINVQIEEPLWFTERYANWEFANAIEAYSHVNSAEAGFESCTFILKVSLSDVDEWLENGLARHVQVYGADTSLVWEGFINKISFGFGTLSAARGPLFDIANRVLVVYTPILDPDTDPPITGATIETPIAQDTDSQARYGIIEKVISGGQLIDDGTTDEAEEVRDLYLAENAYPYTDEEINLAGSNVPTMTIECAGYKEWLKVYPFNDNTASTITLSTKVKNVLDGDPNSIFSTNQSFVEDNAQLTHQLEDKNRIADTIIKEIVTLGDATDTRWTFRVLAGRVAYYSAIPSIAEYIHSLTSRSATVALADKTAIDPWKMPANVWVELTDFMPGQTTQTPMRKDPRNVFAERVTYTAPWGLSISGSRVSKLSQRLAQLGVGGA
jgi:hypothetical protein